MQHFYGRLDVPGQEVEKGGSQNTKICLAS